MAGKNITDDQKRLEDAVVRFMTRGHCKSMSEAGTVIQKSVRDAMSYLAHQELELRRLAEMRCNGKFTHLDETMRNDKEKAVSEYVGTRIGCPCSFQDDPRGLQIRLGLRCPETDGFFNTMDGETSGTGWVYAED